MPLSSSSRPLSFLVLLFLLSGCHAIRRMTTPEVLPDEKFKYYHPNVYYRGDVIRFGGLYCREFSDAEKYDCICFRRDGRFYMDVVEDTSDLDFVIESKSNVPRKGQNIEYGYYRVVGNKLDMHSFQPDTKLQGNYKNVHISQDTLVLLGERFFFVKADTILDKWK